MSADQTATDRQICDYPVCSKRGAGHPQALIARITRAIRRACYVNGFTDYDLHMIGDLTDNWAGQETAQIIAEAVVRECGCPDNGLTDMELAASLSRSEQRRLEFQRCVDLELADPDHEPFTGPFPVRMVVTYHDGPGVQLLSADGQPIVPDLIRDEEQAVWLLRTLNALGGNQR